MKSIENTCKEDLILDFATLNMNSDKFKYENIIIKKHEA